MKTYIEIELERLAGKAFFYRINETMKPTVGHFGPSVLICTGTGDSLDDVLARIIKDICNHEALITWANQRSE